MSPKMHRLGYWGMRPLSNAKSRQAVTKSESEVRVRGHSPLRLHGLAGAAIAGALSPPVRTIGCIVLTQMQASRPIPTLPG